MKKTCARMIVFLLLTAIAVSCSKTVVFKREMQPVRPLKTEAKLIRLHEDFLYADLNGLPLKRLLIEKIKAKMAGQSRYRFEFIPSGSVVPQNDSNRSSIFLIGDIWIQQGKTAGKQVVKVTRTRSGFGVRESWDETERRQWQEGVLQTVVSLYFVEIGSDTKLLRATITASSDQKIHIGNGNRTIANTQNSRFFQDQKVEAGYYLIKSNVDIDSSNRALDQLASQAVSIHFEAL